MKPKCILYTNLQVGYDTYFLLYTTREPLSFYKQDAIPEFLCIEIYKHDNTHFSLHTTVEPLSVYKQVVLNNMIPIFFVYQSTNRLWYSFLLVYNPWTAFSLQTGYDTQVLFTSLQAGYDLTLNDTHFSLCKTRDRFWVYKQAMIPMFLCLVVDAGYGPITANNSGTLTTLTSASLTPQWTSSGHPNKDYSEASQRRLNGELWIIFRTSGWLPLCLYNRSIFRSSWSPCP